VPEILMIVSGALVMHHDCSSAYQTNINSPHGEIIPASCSLAGLMMLVKYNNEAMKKLKINAA